MRAPRILQALTAVLALAAPRAARACSGPGAEAAIGAAIQSATGAAVVTGLAALGAGALYARRRRRGTLAAVPAALLLVHPRWTLAGLWGGDCGHQLAQWARADAVTAVAALAAYAWFTRRPRPAGAGVVSGRDDG
jgi:hypothetical protein